MPTEKQAKKESQKNARIQICENGPYIVPGWIPLVKLTISTDVEGYPASYIEGEEYPINETYTFCAGAGSPRANHFAMERTKRYVLTVPRSPAERPTTLELGKSTGQTSN